MEDRAVIAQYIAKQSATGWRVVSQTDSSVQLVKPKAWNVAGLLLFVVLPALGAFILWRALWLLVLVGAIIVVADYLIRKEKIEFVTADQVRIRLGIRKPMS